MVQILLRITVNPEISQICGKLSAYKIRHSLKMQKRVTANS
jgi:hypothetical protein